MSRYLSTRNISAKFMHAFLSNFANRQTDKRTRANAFTSSFVGGKQQHCDGAKLNDVYLFLRHKNLLRDILDTVIRYVARYSLGSEMLNY